MPSSAVRHFADPDDYATTIRRGQVGLTVSERGNFAAKLTWVDLPRLWMQRFFDNLPRVAEATGIIPGRAYLTFRTQPGPAMVQSGYEVLPSAILRHSKTSEYFQRSSGSADFGTMSLPIEDMASAGEAMGGLDLAPPRDAMPVTPPPAVMARLQRLHAAAGYLAENAPEIIADPDAAHGLEQALIDAMVDCLAHPPHHESGLAQGQHAIVMRRFRKVLEEHPDQALYIPAICKAIRVPERTLRLCCQEHLGMSPKRYLILRRLHLARRALRAATPGRMTVTDIATRYGFWQLGRFAVEYRSLFGESPSTTLHRPPD